jgi:hypothetical protein
MDTKRSEHQQALHDGEKINTISEQHAHRKHFTEQTKWDVIKSTD